MGSEQARPRTDFRYCFHSSSFRVRLLSELTAGRPIADEDSCQPLISQGPLPQKIWGVQRKWRPLLAGISPDWKIGSERDGVAVCSKEGGCEATTFSGQFGSLGWCDQLAKTEDTWSWGSKGGSKQRRIQKGGSSSVGCNESENGSATDCWEIDGGRSQRG